MEGLTGTATPEAGARIGAAFSMIKPRSTVVLTGTTLAAMLLADPTVSPAFTFAIMLGTALTVGGAGALNNVLESRRDALMERTAGRPLPSGELTSGQGSALGGSFCGAGILLLAAAAGPAAAALAAGGAGYYVIVYTALLKPRTHQAVVVGGGAGVFPALIGWTATGADWSPLLLYLAAFIFFWSPPHFWALALTRSEEYRKAGIPVLPVVRGKDETRRQILAYSLALLALSLLPSAASLSGLLYLAVAAPAGIIFSGLALALALRQRDGLADLIYRVSGPYLALFVTAMVVDRLISASGISASGTGALPGGLG